MNIKNIFLIRYIVDEVYMEQPHDFENHNFLNYIFKLNKVLYGLKQALRAWYDRLNKFLLENNFKRKNVDTTLFIERKSKNLLIV